MRRRVVVSGIGAVTTLGHDLPSTCAALRRGDSAVRPARAAAVGGFPINMAEVEGFDARPHFRVPKALKLTNRHTQFAVAAAGMAISDAGWPRDDHALEDVGVIIGSSGFDPQAADLARAVDDDPDGRSVSDIPFFAEQMLSRLNPLWLLVGLPNMTSSHVAIQLQARGPNSSVMTDWAAGVQALGEAAEWIRNDEADAVLAGGADSAIFPHAIASYGQGDLLSERRDGMPVFVPGEGAALLLLEEREHALQRGAHLYGELHGYDAAGAQSPACDNAACSALAVAMQRALDEAGWASGDVGLIGSSIVPAERFIDREARALNMVLGTHATRIPTVTYQGSLGHALAAAGAIDLALLLAMDAPTRSDGILLHALGYSGQAVTLAVTGPASAM